MNSLIVVSSVECVRRKLRPDQTINRVPEPMTEAWRRNLERDSGEKRHTIKMENIHLPDEVAVPIIPVSGGVGCSPL